MRSTPKQHRSQETRKAVVAAAIDLACERGYDRARTRDIARAAYISEGGMFRHFHSKADLYADVFEHVATGLVEDHLAPLAPALVAGDAGAVEAGIRHCLGDRRVALVVDVLSASQFDDELGERMTSVLERVEARMVDTVAAVVDGSGTSAQAAASIRETFEHLLGRSMIVRAFGRDLGTDPVVAELTERLVDRASAAAQS